MKNIFYACAFCLIAFGTQGFVPSKAEGNTTQKVDSQVGKAKNSLAQAGRKESTKRAKAQKLSNKEAYRQAEIRKNTPLKAKDTSPVYDKDTNQAIEKNNNPNDINTNEAE
jgi:hypothetical protein